MPRPAKKRKAAWEDMMKQSIFEATVTVMKEYGPAEIRMDRVARAADMATGTLYNYFKDKDALLLHVLDTLFEPYHEGLVAILNGDTDPQEKLEAYFRQTCEIINEQRDIIAILIRAKDLGLSAGIDRDPEKDYRMKIIRILSGIIEEGVAKGAFRRCDALETAAMVFGAMDGLITLKIKGLVPERTVEEDAGVCMALLLPGLLKAP
jgi:TetR/AcrR family transcriptional repressor of multidrug resistance operon